MSSDNFLVRMKQSALKNGAQEKNGGLSAATGCCIWSAQTGWFLVAM